MEFRLLGPIEVTHEGTPVPLAGTKIHTVLAALLLSHGHVVPDGRLSEFLWRWDPPATMNAQLYTYVSRLRKKFGDVVSIDRRRPGYVLDSDDAWIDTVEYHRLDRLGREALEARHFEKAGALLKAALELWRGAPLANATEFLAEAETPRWEEARVTTLVGRIEADLALGRHAELVPELTRLVADHPLNEGLRAQLMTALYRSSRSADALAVYREGFVILRDELGIEPGPALREAHRLTLDNERPGPSPQPRGRTVIGSGSLVGQGSAPAMLPPDVEDFTGHPQQLAEVVYRLRGASAGRPDRVVITGMPGTGKSALALRAAHLLRHHFPEGQLYADLTEEDGSPRDPYEVLGTFLGVLGMSRHTQPGTLSGRAQLFRGLVADRRILVLLDNVADGAQAAALLPAGDSCRTLLTGRTAPVVDEGTHLVRLHVLSAHEALALLESVAGAGAVRRDPAGAAALVELCDHAPLAVRICGLRLAAGESVAALLARLTPEERRLDALRYGELDVRAGLRRGHAGLASGARRTLRRLAALPVPEFSVSRAAPLLGLDAREAEDALEVLADARLIDVAGLGGDELVYRFAPLVRLFARELAEARGVAPDALST
ncbi:Regulatory protein AfsR [Streptomyces sp. RB5]|uniref:Regulatory protein AfsR n=1 Tax=Streptomyces smaragdinus TaxID=2585196 RepID=A0A7K0CCV1_9ACTN|nr:AfsR/SARP family transcriptional regulator [Streptomyces smaragdinus]MQY11290.1 Regulatory protein AfsR [Streptomyces smaragdinus]